jgi:hypothetical protein
MVATKVEIKKPPEMEAYVCLDANLFTLNAVESHNDKNLRDKKSPKPLTRH